MNVKNAIISEEAIDQIKEIHKKHGSEGFFKKVIGDAFLNLHNNSEPDLILLNYSEAFFVMYRRTGEDYYSDLGRILRRAAHKVYRELMKQNKNKKPNFNRFLTAV
jgi:hypothetical protein